MTKYPCRCWSCWSRRTLKKPLREYVRPPKCLVCGARKLFLCKDRLPSRRGRKQKCTCTGYHFPHRKGSKWCHENPKLEQLYEQHERKQARRVAYA